MFKYFSLWIILSLGLALINCGDSKVKLEAGAARVNMTPDIQQRPVALGGYGDRNGKPATGIRDSIFVRAVVVRDSRKVFCLVSAELDFIPASLKNAVLARLRQMPKNPFTSDNLMLAATHTHAGPTGFALMPENHFNNPRLGIFDPGLLEFTAEAIFRAVQQAFQKLEPVKIGSGHLAVPGMSRNRRGAETTDPELTLARFTNRAGKTLAVLLNFTAHPTIVDPTFMEISGEWPGVLMQNLENALADQPIVLFTNGAEGDQAPVSASGGDAYHRVCQFAAQLQSSVTALMETSPTELNPEFQIQNRPVKLPEFQISETFALTAGDEYQVPTESLIGMVGQLFPSELRLTGVRLGEFALVGLPGEMMAALGLEIKHALLARQMQHPIIVGLTDDYVGYILSKAEYRKGGYEAAVSFYGETLGELLVSEAVALVQQF